VFENKVLRRIYELKEDEVTGVGENCMRRGSIPCILRQVQSE
jgi:hypothetical protein